MARFNTDRLKLEIQRSQGPFLWLIVIIVFGLIGAYAVVSNLTGNFPFTDKYEVRVQVDDVSGIAPGRQQVEMAGVKVGVVQASELVRGKAVLTLALERKYAPLYKDATFQIRPNTPLDDLFVTITDRGSEGAGELDKRDVVPVDQTTTPVKISRVLNVFQPDTRASMRALFDELARSAPDNGERLRAAFAEAAPFFTVADRTLGVLDERRELLARAMTNFSRLTYGLGERNQQIESLITDGNSALGKLAEEDGPFADTLREIPPTMTVARSAFATLRAAEDDLDPALESLQPVAATLRRSLDSLSELAGAANPALARLQPALRDVRPFAGQLRPTAGALRGAFQRLRPQTPSFDRITQLVQGCEDGISSFFNNTVSVFKFYDGYGSWPRGNNTADTSSIGGTGTATLKQYTPCTGPLK